jgi:hydroxymethylpyrimidine/phosphomethylpyrimidine kinase
VLEDMPVAAFKVGMIGSIDNVVAIAELIADYPDIPLIYDPVLASGAGDELAREDMIHVLRDVLLPQVTVLTPNSIEARRLAANDADDEEELSVADCAKRLTRLGCDYVFITGTHEPTRDVENRLYDLGGEIRVDTWPRLNGSFHGSGCTLAAAIAGLVARGLAVPEAVKEAQDYTWQALRYGFRPGMGQFIPDRLFWANDDAGDDDADKEQDANV